MAVVAGLAGLISVLTSWIVGVRLVLLSRRTHQLPELLIGLALLLTGGLWSPLVAIGRQAVALSDGVRAVVVAVGCVGGVLGMSSLAVFIWRTYRPADRSAAVAAGAVPLVLCAVFAAQSFGRGWAEFARTESGPWLLASWTGVAIYAWSNVEAWRQYGMQRRRQALGLADPVVTDRMRLWALAMAAALAGSSVLAVCQTAGVPVGGTALGLGLTAVVACGAAACLWLAFAPPAAYLARVRAAAGATSS
jgi:hypothetical protein